MRRHQIDLEFGRGGYLAGVFERLEHGIRLLGDVGIEQIAELHVRGAQSRLERETLAAGAAACVHAEELARFHKGRIVGKDRLEPGDPVAALAGFAVRQPLDARAERGADLREDVLRIRHRHAADEIDVARHQSLAQTSAWIFRSVRTVSSERARAMPHSVAMPKSGA